MKQPEIGKLYLPKIIRNHIGEPTTVRLYHESQELSWIDKDRQRIFLLIFIQNSHGPFHDISPFASSSDFGFRYKFLWGDKLVWTEPIAGFKENFFSYFVPYSQQ